MSRVCVKTGTSVAFRIQPEDKTLSVTGRDGEGAVLERPDFVEFTRFNRGSDEYEKYSVCTVSNRRL